MPLDRQSFADYLVNRLKKGELEPFFDVLNDMSLIRQRRSGLKIMVTLIKQEFYRQLPSLPRLITDEASIIPYTYAVGGYGHLRLVD